MKKTILTFSLFFICAMCFSQKLPKTIFEMYELSADQCPFVSEEGITFSDMAVEEPAPPPPPPPPFNQDGNSPKLEEWEVDIDNFVKYSDFKSLCVALLKIPLSIVSQ